VVLGSGAGGAGRIALLLLFVLCVSSLSGCKRGALMDWLRERNALPGGPAVRDRTATLEGVLHGTDCPDGLARCVAGAVEVSHVARVPNPCPQATIHPEECQCPWEAIETCPKGCSAEGTVVVTPPSQAAPRLCAPDPSNPPARPAPAAIPPAGACTDTPPGTYRCVGSLVVSCADATAATPTTPADPRAPPIPRVIAACIRGCADESQGGDFLDEEEADPEAAARILCAR
jgi:hypothetical protein